MRAESPFQGLVDNPESDEVREKYGRIEDHLDTAIDALVHRNLLSVRRSLVRALRELNSQEIA